MCEGQPCANLPSHLKREYYENYKGTGMKYNAHDDWKQVRQAKFLSDPACHSEFVLWITIHPSCNRCSLETYNFANSEEAKGWFHVHHKCYKHVFNEKDHLEDLEVLCQDCHDKEHNRA